MEWKNIYRGFLMGITDLIPGVSGGTMAIILGVYDRLLEALSGFFSKKWRQQLSFLVPLAIGIVSALLLFSRLIAYLLQNYFEPTQFFFLGLIIGIIPFIIKGADVKRNFAFRHWFVLIAAAILLALTGFMNPNKAVEPITSLNTLSILGLFLAGWLASMAMLLPGISGSFVLLLLGVYSTGIYALSTFNIPLIVTIGSGVIVGFAVSSKGIRYAITRFPYMTFAIISVKVTLTLPILRERKKNAIKIKSVKVRIGHSRLPRFTAGPSPAVITRHHLA